MWTEGIGEGEGGMKIMQTKYKIFTTLKYLNLKLLRGDTEDNKEQEK